MFLILSSDDCTRLKPDTLADIMAIGLRPPAVEASTPSAAREPVPDADDFDMEDVVDLTPRQVAEFVDGIHQQTIDGLRVFAEHGPVIDAHLLNAVGITNYSHFQGRVTKRTRTITGNKDAFLFGWDDWKWDDATDTLQSGRYAVSQVTYRSLRRFFALD